MPLYPDAADVTRCRQTQLLFIRLVEDHPVQRLIREEEHVVLRPLPAAASRAQLVNLGAAERTKEAKEAHAPDQPTYHVKREARIAPHPQILISKVILVME